MLNKKITIFVILFSLIGCGSKSSEDDTKYDPAKNFADKCLKESGKDSVAHEAFMRTRYRELQTYMSNISKNPSDEMIRKASIAVSYFKDLCPKIAETSEGFGGYIMNQPFPND